MTVVLTDDVSGVVAEPLFRVSPISTRISADQLWQNWEGPMLESRLGLCDRNFPVFRLMVSGSALVSEGLASTASRARFPVGLHRLPIPNLPSQSPARLSSWGLDASFPPILFSSVSGLMHILLKLMLRPQLTPGWMLSTKWPQLTSCPARGPANTGE